MRFTSCTARGTLLVGLFPKWIPMFGLPSAAGWAESASISSRLMRPPSIGVEITCGFMSTISSVRFFCFSVPRKRNPTSGIEPRTGVLEAASGSKTFTAEFTQLALGSTLGVWNYDGRGANLVYDELCWQTSVRRYPNGMADSRLLDVVNGKYMVIKGIPVSAAVGSSITVNVQQNWINFLSWQREATFEVVRTAPDKIWLADLGTVYIVRL